MGFKTKPDPETQILNTHLAYLDNLTPGSGLQEPAAAASQNLAFDINALRTLLRLHLTGGSGSRKWYDTVLDNFGLDQVHDKKMAYDTGIRAGTQDFTLSGTPGGVLVDGTMLDSVSPKIAVGPSSASSGGYIAAEEAAFTVAGTLGIGTSQAVDAAGIILNLATLVDAATNESPTTGTGEPIFGLVQCLDGSADDVSVAAAASENLQISFVYVDDSTDVITATTLPAGDYHFALRRQTSFYDAPVGMIVGGGAGAEVVDPGATILKVPFREIDITGTAPAANDPMTITTGTFVTAGAQTVAATYGTPALPASGAAFRDDPRIKIWISGILASKGTQASDDRDVYWISTTQVAFEDKLKDAVIYIEAPASY